MVALKGMLVKWSNHCYDHPIDEDRDYEPAHDAHGALSKWKKLWPSKQARLSCQKRSNSNAVRSDIGDSRHTFIPGRCWPAVDLFDCADQVLTRNALCLV